MNVSSVRMPEEDEIDAGHSSEGEVEFQGRGRELGEWRIAEIIENEDRADYEDDLDDPEARAALAEDYDAGEGLDYGEVGNRGQENHPVFGPGRPLNLPPYTTPILIHFVH
ncbi:hypothetical protein B9Z19DRAFT_1119357 [Tuber borchii]|uniref:Uncharacterized protein n=1 Tax=Tuber borchii TaxID=42251 RepID=A0A2T7A6N1_TUBBO|nr:hypothetical protein B9Z19DRAFT_1119357 [Tuber borchii]